MLQFGTLQGLEWHFCSPDAPWQNGTAEALIKSVKKSLSIAIGEQVLAFSELQTVLFEAANIVNERPIGVNPNNADDGSYLCPNDIILGRASARVPNGQFRNCSSLKRLVFVQSIVESFWKRWVRDYFPSLIIRSKWHTMKRNLKVGDIVMIQRDNPIRSCWKLGRISKVYPSNIDVCIRNVDVEYKSDDISRKMEVIRRPVQKHVVILPVDAEQE